MRRCRENSSSVRTKTTGTVNTSVVSCCCREYVRLLNNLRLLQRQNLACPDTQPLPRIKDLPEGDNRLNTIAKSGKKTWFEVLRESPKKYAKNDSVRKQVLFDDAQFVKSHQLHGFTLCDMGKFNLSLDDENFLQKLIEINRAFQDTHAAAVEQAYCLKHKVKNPGKHSRKYITQAGSRNIPITDDDKFNFQKPRAERKSTIDSRERRERQNLQVKATVKLLENMQNVSENTEIQLEVLHNITKLILQLREENNMLDKLREIRIDLESKLASLSSENSYLTKRLHTTECERDEANHRLVIKEQEINVLKKHIIALKGTIAGKINSSICDLNDASYEIPILDESIESPPSNSHSFDAPIRPASSSPVGGKQPDNNQSNLHRDTDKSRIVNLLELKTNVKKTVDQFESEFVKLNDVSLNLSDATYKLSSLSLI